MVGSKVMALLTRYSCVADQTSSLLSSASIATAKKTASKKLCKILSGIQRANQKLWPFGAVTLVWRTKPPHHRVPIP